MGIIYIATNSINGKQYVGQTHFDLKTRLSNHLIRTRAQNDNVVFHKAIRKYGISTFSFEEIMCDDNKLDEIEIRLIKELNTKVPNGYNITEGGRGSIGTKHSQETKDKISKSKIGRVLTEEHKQKLREKSTGFRHSQETKDKLSKIITGRKVMISEEERERRRKRLKEVGIKNHKRWFLTDPNGVEHFVNESLEKFCLENHLHRTILYRVLTKKQKHHKGWTIRLDENPNT
jgi:group I intron endonuclease